MEIVMRKKMKGISQTNKAVLNKVNKRRTIIKEKYI